MPLSNVPDKIRETNSVIPIPPKRNSSSKPAAESEPIQPACTVKNMEISRIKVGNRQDGKQPFPWGINNSAACYTGCITAQSHTHCQCLLAAGMRPLEMPIQMEGNPWQIAQILQQRKKRKENCHWRQHDRHHPRQDAINAVHHHAFQPVWTIASLQQPAQAAAHLL